MQLFLRYRYKIQILYAARCRQICVTELLENLLDINRRRSRLTLSMYLKFF